MSKYNWWIGFSDRKRECGDREYGYAVWKLEFLQDVPMDIMDELTTEFTRLTNKLLDKDEQ